MTRDQIVTVIHEAIDRVNEIREPEERIDRSEDAGLFGSDGGLDSLSLVSLVLDVEEAVSSIYGVQLVLADERAMARRRSPFRDVRSLADYVLERLEEEGVCVRVPSS